MGLVRHQPAPAPSRRSNPTTAMFRFLLILGLGVAIGYGYGWRDAQKHTKHVAERLVERIGGDNKENFSNDVDGQVVKAERR